MTINLSVFRELDLEDTSIENRYIHGMMNWNEYVDAQRDLYARALIAGHTDLVQRTEEWAESLDADCPDLPPILGDLTPDDMRPVRLDAAITVARHDSRSIVTKIMDTPNDSERRAELSQQYLAVNHRLVTLKLVQDSIAHL